MHSPYIDLHLKVYLPELPFLTIKVNQTMWPEIAAFICILFTILLSLQCARKSQPKLPPGPRGLPLIGHLHLLGSFPHHSLHKLSQIHGPIMSLRFGLIPTIVFSSPEYTEIFLKTHDSIFASRPLIQASKFLSYGQKNLIFAQYGSYWRNIRKLCTIELLNSSKIESFRNMRYEEVCNVVDVLKNFGGEVEVDLTAKIYSVIEDITYRMILGSKDRYNFKSTLHEIGRLAGLANVSDYIPFLAPLDLQGLGRQLKALSKALDEVLEKIIEEHAANAKQKQNKDFIDMMLSLMESNNTRELQLDRDNIKAIILDMLSASVDTSSTVIEWTIADLLKNPRVMKLLQKELEGVVGCNRMVEEIDLIKLDYLKIVIKESMRIHPVAPLLLPHESTEDITVNGYFIPKKSRLLVNTWSIGRDPNIWSENAEEFYPERFISTNIDVEGRDFRFIPFGSGRRKCPGIQLGFTVVQLVVAQLVHCFDLELPSGMVSDDLDMDERFGLTVPRANHLIVVPRYRLKAHPGLIL